MNSRNIRHVLAAVLLAGCGSDATGVDPNAVLGQSGFGGTAGGGAGIGAGVAGVDGTGFAGSGAGSGFAGSGVSNAGSGAIAGSGGVAGSGALAGSGGAGGVGGAAAEGGSGTGAPIVCNAGATRPTDGTRMIMWDGKQREYILHVPASYDGSKAVPLVIDIHGLTSSASAQKGLSGWQAKADKEGFIIAWPNGLNNSWNGGDLCCGQSQSSGVDDEGFIRAVVEELEADACIDPKRVYATGLSNGGAMSHLLACNAADVFAATAPVSMGNGTKPCTPSRPISVIMFRGTSDTLVSYNGGVFPSAKADFDQWKMLDSCTGSASKTHSICDTYTGCAGGTEVTLCTIQNGMHVVYSQSASAGAPVPDVAWEAFSRQTLP